MIVWMASYPRSGNTFVRTLLYHLYGVKTHSLHGDHLFDSLGASEAIGHTALPGTIEELADDDRVYFVKTHDLPVDFRPAIYVVRDGRSSVVSYAHYKQAFETPSRVQKIADLLAEKVLGKSAFASRLRQVITDISDFGGWSGNVLSWLCRKRGQVSLVRYEDLVADPVGVVQRAMADVAPDLKPVSSSYPSFEELNARWPSFFRKGRVDSWKTEFTDDLHSLFWDHHGEAMDVVGYAR